MVEKRTSTKKAKVTSKGDIAKGVKKVIAKKKSIKKNKEVSIIPEKVETCKVLETFSSIEKFLDNHFAIFLIVFMILLVIDYRFLWLFVLVLALLLESFLINKEKKVWVKNKLKYLCFVIVVGLFCNLFSYVIAFKMSFRHLIKHPICSENVVYVNNPNTPNNPFVNKIEEMICNNREYKICKHFVNGKCLDYWTVPHNCIEWDLGICNKFAKEE